MADSIKKRQTESMRRYLDWKRSQWKEPDFKFEVPQRRPKINSLLESKQARTPTAENVSLSDFVEKLKSGVIVKDYEKALIADIRANMPAAIEELKRQGREYAESVKPQYREEAKVYAEGWTWSLSDDGEFKIGNKSEMAEEFEEGLAAGFRSIRPSYILRRALSEGGVLYMGSGPR